jgi:hypothetical protein
MPAAVPTAASAEESVKARSEAMPEAIRSHARGAGQNDSRAGPVLEAAVEIRNGGHSCGLKGQMEFQTCKDGIKSPAGKMCLTKKDKATPTGVDGTE